MTQDEIIAEIAALRAHVDVLQAVLEGTIPVEHQLGCSARGIGNVPPCRCQAVARTIRFHTAPDETEPG